MRASNSSQYYEPKLNTQQRRSVQANDRNAINSTENYQQLRYDNQAPSKVQSNEPRQQNLRTLEEKKYEY